ncbi:hypothetical protein [Streptomyces sp. NPDC002676]
MALRGNCGDFDCSGEDVERDWVARTGCWSRVRRVLLTDDQVQRLVIAAVGLYVDRDVLAEQQRRALSDFLAGWGAAGGTSA